jgi:hypothetical protein
MFRITFSLLALIMACMALPCAGESIEGLPLHVQKLAPGAVRVWVGDEGLSPTVFSGPSPLRLIFRPCRCIYRNPIKPMEIKKN